MKKKINILMIGAGRIAEQHAYAYRNQNIFYKNMPFEINLNCLVDKDRKILNKVKKKFLSRCFLKFLFKLSILFLRKTFGFLIYLFQSLLLVIKLIFIISAFFLISPNDFGN